MLWVEGWELAGSHVQGWESPIDQSVDAGACSFAVHRYFLSGDVRTSL
jgi:hypothetical protein